MKILVKFPTRERPQQFLSTLRGYIDKQSTDNVHYLITLDANDPSMNNNHMKATLEMMPNVTVHYGISSSKIHAINRDMHKYAAKWDILALASDDMICQKEGWDQIIIDAMTEHYPDTDGCLWFHDGDQNTLKKLCTMVIMGFAYRQRTGYTYHPLYTSLWADNEYTAVAEILERITWFLEVLFKHVHYSNTRGLKQDALMLSNQRHYYSDEKVYKQRKSINFGL